MFRMSGDEELRRGSRILELGITENKELTSGVLLLYTAEAARWSASRRLKLNTNKTDARWFGSRSNLKKNSVITTVSCH
jgi:hypothetical protein